MKNYNNTTTQLKASNHHQKAALLTGVAVLQLAAASSIGAATTSILGGAGLNPWGPTGSVHAQPPAATTTSLVNVSLAVPGTQTDIVGNWDISGTGASSVSVSALGIGTTLASWAAETEITSNSVQFNVATGGTIVDTLVQVPVLMNWSATIAVPSVNYEANTTYDVSFDISVAAGLLSNAAALGETVQFTAIDGNGAPVAGFGSGGFIDLVGLLGANPTGTYTNSFTIGNTVPTGDIRLQFQAVKGVSAELLGFSSDYVEISGLTMDATPVPEPSGALLLGAGALIFILRRRV